MYQQYDIISSHLLPSSTHYHLLLECSHKITHQYKYVHQTTHSYSQNANHEKSNICSEIHQENGIKYTLLSDDSLLLLNKAKNIHNSIALLQKLLFTFQDYYANNSLSLFSIWFESCKNKQYYPYCYEQTQCNIEKRQFELIAQFAVTAAVIIQSKDLKSYIQNLSKINHIKDLFLDNNTDKMMNWLQKIYNTSKQTNFRILHHELQIMKQECIFDKNIINNENKIIKRDTRLKHSCSQKSLNIKNLKNKNRQYRKVNNNIFKMAKESTTKSFREKDIIGKTLANTTNNFQQQNNNYMSIMGFTRCNQSLKNRHSRLQQTSKENKKQFHKLIQNNELIHQIYESNKFNNQISTNMIKQQQKNKILKQISSQISNVKKYEPIINNLNNMKINTKIVEIQYRNCKKRNNRINHQIFDIWFSHIIIGRQEKTQQKQLQNNKYQQNTQQKQLKKSIKQSTNLNKQQNKNSSNLKQNIKQKKKLKNNNNNNNNNKFNKNYFKLLGDILDTIYRKIFFLKNVTSNFVIYTIYLNYLNTAINRQLPKITIEKMENQLIKIRNTQQNYSEIPSQYHPYLNLLQKNTSNSIYQSENVMRIYFEHLKTIIISDKVRLIYNGDIMPMLRMLLLVALCISAMKGDTHLHSYCSIMKQHDQSSAEISKNMAYFDVKQQILKIIPLIQ